MVQEVAVHCGGFEPRTKKRVRGRAYIDLRLSGANQNTRLKISDISVRMAGNIPDVLQDLIEVATYVYCADQAVARGDAELTGRGKSWRRSFEFFVPVRNPGLWSSTEVHEGLKDALNCVTDDQFRFTFEPLGGSFNFKEYLELAPDKSDIPIEEVLLFSGGLDSLAGVVQESVVAKRRVALVSHRSSPKIDKTQNELVRKIRARCPERPPLHVPVWINKEERLTRDYTQRTRSFLYSSLAATTARMLNLDRIRFYENGITSWNLPISDQLIGAKASRTTHPQALTKLEALLRILFRCDFKIDNPLIWKTKPEVVNEIDAAGCAELIQYTVSCQHTWEQTKEHPHCGVCFQCVGRRFAMLASGCVQYEPAQKYKTDLLTGSRRSGIDRTLIESYYRTAADMGSLNDFAFLTRFGEINRALTLPVLNHLSGTADEIASKILDLHRRHSVQVVDVVNKALQTHSSDILSGGLPDSCLIALAVPEKYKTLRTPVAAPSAIEENEPHGPRGAGQYSEGDDSVYRRILKLCNNQNAFAVWTDSELLLRIRQHREADPILKGRSDNALRSCFRRIRHHHVLLLSRAIKNMVNNDH